MKNDSDHFYRDLLDNLTDGIYFVDRDRKFIYWNKGAERISGYKDTEMAGRFCADNLLMHINDEGTLLCKTLCPLAKTLMDGRVRDAEVYLRHKEGHRVPVSVRVSPIRNSTGEIIGAVELFRESTTETALLKQLEDVRKTALLDPVTGLANRRYIDMALNSRLDELKRYGWPFAVLFNDIDNFKLINDTYGHGTGDKILTMVARSLASNLRSFDLLGRYGGDEFLAVITNVHREQLYSFANRLRLLVEQSNLATPYGRIGITLSIGATLAQAGDTIETLIHRADHLMYQSKTRGRNRVSLDEDTSPNRNSNL